MTPYTHKVQYYETDMMGVVHHANYVRWMEEARIDFLDQLGFSYARMERENVFSPVKAIACEYRRPSVFGDVIAVRVSVESFNGVVMAVAYTMTNQAGDTVLTARSEHVFLNREGRFVRMKRDMPAFCEAVERQLAGGKNGADNE